MRDEADFGQKSLLLGRRWHPIRMTDEEIYVSRARFYSEDTQTKRRRLALARRLVVWGLFFVILFTLFNDFLSVECGADNCGKLRIIGDDEIYVELI